MKVYLFLHDTHLQSKQRTQLYMVFLTLCIWIRLVFEAIAAFEVPCEDEWIRSNTSGTCLRVHEEERTWEEARVACHIENADLIKIMFEDMNKEVLDLLQETSPYYIGIWHQADGRDILSWLDDTESVNYHRINVRPQGKVCGSINKVGSGAWLTFNCDEAKKFICQRSTHALCPYGYFANNSSRTCFKLNRDKLNFTSSRLACMEDGGDLAMIFDQETNDVLYDLLIQHKNETAFVGMYDLETEDKATWLDFLDKPNFTAWENPKQDVWGKGMCLVLNSAKRKKPRMWWNEDCDVPHFSICEKYPDCKMKKFDALCHDCSNTNCGDKCHPRTGSCVGCAPGFKGGLFCEDPCTNNTWGQDCTENCSQNCVWSSKACDHRTGRCLDGCVPGFAGDMCDEPPFPDLIQIIIIGAIGGLLTILVVTITLRCKKRRVPQEVVVGPPPEDPEPKPEAIEELPETEEWESQDARFCSQPTIEGITVYLPVGRFTNDLPQCQSLSVAGCLFYGRGLRMVVSDCFPEAVAA